MIWERIAEQISQTTGQPFEMRDRRTIGGGSINQAYAVGDRDRTFFVKLNQATRLDMFEAEQAGLQEIYASQTIRVPQPLCCGTAGDTAYIVMEWLPLGRGNDSAWAQMGERLAAMHRVTHPQGFGWHRANTIGETPQQNTWSESWLQFYRQQRLEYQFELARRRGGRFPQAKQLLAHLPNLLAGHDPAPALVHGDLWSGNAAVAENGEPVIVDPATYYGDREVDLAMTELFGRFSNAFYQAYEAAYPLDPGYARRKTLYNLYHILNHFNQFGGSYQSQANGMIERLLT
ncbi:fructosamine kinase family protein [Romeria aff. gracilis LEGE 07310]|uniref:Fructosamine kinase family protein n=1 Tax=Vasconcelosia minhoensis LEGE 07310 TaxID=915328 RepID=A0A8J7A9S0_9CYAN|nr:fructosamine kinase family protein [Romeria gracilis]MBE9078835.1 fructosamine kinase family protein [Romeria aff. gracilis LEGE 07310]